MSAKIKKNKEQSKFFRKKFGIIRNSSYLETRGTGLETRGTDL